MVGDFATTFEGFPKAAVQFYKDLKQNNDRLWFNEHKGIYEQQVLAPAQAFVSAMGERLKTLSPKIVTDTRTNGSGSIFRIYNDVRFSKDKTPYKPYLGIFFWEGGDKKMDNPGLYLHLELGKLMLFAGMHKLPKPMLDAYRRAVVDPEKGDALLEVVQLVTANPSVQIGGRHYKKLPAGYETTPDKVEYLLYDGLYAFIESDIPPEFYTPEILDYCLERFRVMYPIQQWLINSL
jgi:uncharacterized protein (TIGR02453 family)